MNIVEEEVKKIALKHLFLETIETRRSDRLDFHEHGVSSIKAALVEAMLVGAAIVMNNLTSKELRLQAAEFLKKD